MAITYTWKVDMIHLTSAAGITDAVAEVHWSKTGVNENGVKGRYPGVSKYTTQHAQAAIDAGSFIPFNQLTEEKVLDWVRATLSDENEAFIDSRISAEIQSQITTNNNSANKSVGEGAFPWSTGNK